MSSELLWVLGLVQLVISLRMWEANLLESCVCLHCKAVSEDLIADVTLHI